MAKVIHFCYLLFKSDDIYIVLIIRSFKIIFNLHCRVYTVCMLLLSNES